MRILLFTLLTISLTSAQKSSKDSDEDRPYEFGFTIDGQQHRHEKKDSNGIIQGEFGFITADGVYHVTVYATDENGNFKILSMKNIRVSAPLDGSPATGPISPDAAKYIGKQSPPAAQTTSTQAPQQFQRLQEQPKAVTQFQGFTTQPTIRPACAGCGYVTIAKPVAGQAFGVLSTPRPQGPPQLATQTQTGYNQGESLDLVQIPDAEVIPQGLGVGRPSQFGGQIQPSQFQGQQPNVQQNGQSQLQGPHQNQKNLPQDKQSYGQYQQQNQGPQPNQQSQQLFSNSQNGFNQQTNVKANIENVQANIASIASGINTPNLLASRINNGNQGINPPGQGNQAVVAGGIDPSVQSQQISQLPPISVDDNVIHVGGQKPQDIPIKDKFPGMVAGLPDGIEEKDVTNILYKFKYTVGFHGHWEKGLKNGAKIGGYFVNGRDGISRVVTYIADENGYRPKFKFVNLGLDSDETPKEGSEKKFGLKSFEFVWYPLE